MLDIENKTHWTDSDLHEVLQAIRKVHNEKPELRLSQVKQDEFVDAVIQTIVKESVY